MLNWVRVPTLVEWINDYLSNSISDPNKILARVLHEDRIDTRGTFKPFPPSLETDD